MPSRSHEPSEALTLDPEMARAEAEIDRTREQVSRSVLALRQAMTQRTDWREWVRRGPLPFLAVAFMIGFVYGQKASRAGTTHFR